MLHVPGMIVEPTDTVILQRPSANMEHVRGLQPEVEQDASASCEAVETLGTLPDVWLQIDRSADRLVPLFGPCAGQYNCTAGELLQSPCAGQLQFKPDCMLWDDAGFYARSRGTRIYYRQMTRILSGRIDLSGEFDDESAATLRTAADIEQGCDDDDDDDDNDVTSRRTEYGELADENAPHYICLHVSGGFAVKFFPLLLSELADTVSFLENATGLKISDELEVIGKVLERQHKLLRARVLHDLEAAELSPWVATTADLLAVMKNLLSEGRAASIHDLERLFHSCRHRAEVTTETLTRLERAWQLRVTETAQHRVLSVIERLAESSDILTAANIQQLQRWPKSEDSTSVAVRARIIKLRRKLEGFTEHGPIALNCVRLDQEFNWLDGYRLHCTLDQLAIAPQLLSTETRTGAARWKQNVRGVIAARVLGGRSLTKAPQQPQSQEKSDGNDLLGRWRQAIHGVEAANYITRVFRPAPTPQQVADEAAQLQADASEPAQEYGKGAGVGRWRQAVRGVEAANFLSRAFSGGQAAAEGADDDSPAEEARQSIWRRSIQRVQVVNFIQRTVKSSGAALVSATAAAAASAWRRSVRNVRTVNLFRAPVHAENKAAVVETTSLDCNKGVAMESQSRFLSFDNTSRLSEAEEEEEEEDEEEDEEDEEEEDEDEEDEEEEAEEDTAATAIAAATTAAAEMDRLSSRLSQCFEAKEEEEMGEEEEKEDEEKEDEAEDEAEDEEDKEDEGAGAGEDKFSEDDIVDALEEEDEEDDGEDDKDEDKEEDNENKQVDEESSSGEPEGRQPHEQQQEADATCATSKGESQTEHLGSPEPEPIDTATTKQRPQCALTVWSAELKEYVTARPSEKPTVTPDTVCGLDLHGGPARIDGSSSLHRVVD